MTGPGPYVFPEKWCIRQNASEEVCAWFNDKFNAHSHIGGGYRYLVNFEDKLESIYEDDPPEGYPEITLEQFEQYVLLRPVPPPRPPEDLNYLADIIKKLNIT